MKCRATSVAKNQPFTFVNAQWRKVKRMQTVEPQWTRRHQLSAQLSSIQIQIQFQINTNTNANTNANTIANTNANTNTEANVMQCYQARVNGERTLGRF